MSKARFSSLEEYWDSVADPQAKAWLAEHLQVVLSEEVKEYFLERLSICDRVSTSHYRRIKQLLQASFIPEDGFYKVDFLQVAYLLQGFETSKVYESVLSVLTEPLRDDEVAFPFTTYSTQSSEYERVLEVFFLVYCILQCHYKPVGVVAESLVLEVKAEVTRLNLIDTLTLVFSFGIGFSVIGSKNHVQALPEHEYRELMSERRLNVVGNADSLGPLRLAVELGYVISASRAIFWNAKNPSNPPDKAISPEVIQCWWHPDKLSLEMGEAMQNLRKHQVRNSFAALRKRAVYLQLRKLGLKKLDS